MNSDSGPGDSLLLRLEKPSDIPVESLHGRKEDPGRTIRLNITGALPGESLGEFSLQPQHGAVRAVFVSLSFLQKELEQDGRVNTILVARFPGTQPQINEQSIADVTQEQSRRSKISGSTCELSTTSKASRSKAAARSSTITSRRRLVKLQMRFHCEQFRCFRISRTASTPVIVRCPTRSSPRWTTRHSQRLPNQPQQSSQHPPIILNEWAARDLNAKPGDTVSLEYYLWHENGRLETKKADFQLSGVVPIAGLAADRDLVPEYPGITESEDLSDWDPPFPIDLDRVRKEDEDYWHQYRTTPKAFIPLSAAQNLWQTRFGKLTSIRIESAASQLTPEIVNNYRESLRQKLGSGVDGISGRSGSRCKDRQLRAARLISVSTFLYFSFFLVVSALMLTTLFFKLGIEQRAREIGTLQAIGFSDAGIRRLFLAEGMLLAVVGSLLGLARSDRIRGVVDARVANVVG